MNIQTSKHSPLLNAKRVAYRPPSEEWTIKDKVYSTEELRDLPPELSGDDEVTYRFRTESFKNVIGAAVGGAAFMATLGAVGAPVLSAVFNGAQSVASVVAWPAVPPPSGIGSLLGVMGTGAVTGAVAGATMVGGIMGLMYLADRLNPTEAKGVLEKHDGRLAFKIRGTEHAIDLNRHAQGSQESPNVEQWWQEVARVSRDQRAGYGVGLEF